MLGSASSKLALWVFLAQIRNVKTLVFGLSGSYLVITMLTGFVLYSTSVEFTFE